MALWRVQVEGEPRLAVGSVGEGPRRLLPRDRSIDQLLSASTPFLDYRDDETQPLSVPHTVVVPLESQEVWASGVTFEESRYAREAESTAPDFYRDVYFADRPELFLKASPGTAVGIEQIIGVRADSEWNVPEPEVGLVVDARGQLVAFTLGNDVSSRSIEGANPLYLPQAKIYDGSCAVGPCLVPLDEAESLEAMTIHLTVKRDGAVAFEGSSKLAELRREPAEMISWLFRARSFPKGVVLLTGTGIVPPEPFTLISGDRVLIQVQGLGVLANDVGLVGMGSEQRP